MTTRTVTLNEELDLFVVSQVESGRYHDASEVVRAALTSFQRHSEEDTDRLEDLRSAIDEGDASGYADGGVFERTRQTVLRSVS